MDSKKRAVADETDAESVTTGVGTPAAADGLTEDQALALLRQGDLLSEEVERLVSSAVIKSRKVRLAAAGHPRTPRRIALRLVRELYTFDLARFTLTPAVAADLKRLADDLLVARLPAVTLGERIALGRRSSPMVAGALLLDKDSRVWQAALENPRLTESAVVRALQNAKASPGLVSAVCRHAKWSRVRKFASRCCEIRTRRWLALWNSPAACPMHNCGRCCTPRACPKRSSAIYEAT